MQFQSSSSATISHAFSILMPFAWKSCDMHSRSSGAPVITASPIQIYFCTFPAAPILCVKVCAHLKPLLAQGHSISPLVNFGSFAKSFNNKKIQTTEKSQEEANLCCKKYPWISQSFRNTEMCMSPPHMVEWRSTGCHDMTRRVSNSWSPGKKKPHVKENKIRSL